MGLLVGQVFESGMDRNKERRKYLCKSFIYWKDIYLKLILHEKTFEEPKEYLFAKLPELSVIKLYVAPCDQN